jgi:2-polyprenyl-3-methyl-5-hydroxy-6-metoxy-1,4-benzoquinol methylase
VKDAAHSAQKDPLSKLKTSWSTLYKTRREIQRKFPDFWDLKVRKKHLEIVLEEVRDGDSILDIGSSTRELRHRLIDVSGRRVIYKSMDIDRETKQDYYSIEEIKEKFNVIFLFEVIEHLSFEDGVQLLDTIYDLLLPGGKLILTTPNSFHPNRYWEYSHKVSYRYDEIGGILISLGFKVKDIFRIYNDAFFRRLVRIWLAAPLHKYLCVDFAKSILVVAVREK